MLASRPSSLPSLARFIRSEIRCAIATGTIITLSFTPTGQRLEAFHNRRGFRLGFNEASYTQVRRLPHSLLKMSWNAGTGSPLAKSLPSTGVLPAFSDGSQIAGSLVIDLENRTEGRRVSKLRRPAIRGLFEANHPAELKSLPPVFVASPADREPNASPSTIYINGPSHDRLWPTYGTIVSNRSHYDSENSRGVFRTEVLNYPPSSAEEWGWHNTLTRVKRAVSVAGKAPSEVSLGNTDRSLSEYTVASDGNTVPLEQLGTFKYAARHFDNNEELGEDSIHAPPPSPSKSHANLPIEIENLSQKRRMRVWVSTRFFQRNPNGLLPTFVPAHPDFTPMPPFSFELKPDTPTKDELRLTSNPSTEVLPPSSPTPSVAASNSQVKPSHSETRPLPRLKPLLWNPRSALRRSRDRYAYNTNARTPLYLSPDASVAHEQPSVVPEDSQRPTEYPIFEAAALSERSNVSILPLFNTEVTSFNLLDRSKHHPRRYTSPTPTEQMKWHNQLGDWVYQAHSLDGPQELGEGSKPIKSRRLTLKRARQHCGSAMRVVGKYICIPLLATLKCILECPLNTLSEPGPWLRTRVRRFYDEWVVLPTYPRAQFTPHLQATISHPYWDNMMGWLGQAILRMFSWAVVFKPMGVNFSRFVFGLI